MAERADNWIQDHIDRYIATNGEDGHMWNGLPTLLLTTRGRRTGNDRLLPLIYGESNGAYVIVGSKGGNAKHPSWYLNLVADPIVTVQVKADKFNARARTAEGDERARLWEVMSGIFPTYNEYKERASPRVVPIVVLERTESSS